jgi:hypothetical protein
MIEYKVTVYHNRTVWKNSEWQFHREDGPALEYKDGNNYWYLNGKLHREDGPAIERDSGNKSWWLNGLRHRTDGPAIEYADGTKFWFINGFPLTEEEFNKKINSLDGKIATIDGIDYTLEIV